MNGILASLRWQLSRIYLDNMVLFSKSKASYIEHVQRLILLLYEVGTTPKQMKCNFFAETIDYLSHVIRYSSFKLAECTTDAVAKNQTSQYTD